MVIHTTKGLPSMDMLRQDPAPPLLRDASFPTDTTTTLVTEDSVPPLLRDTSFPTDTTTTTDVNV
jgi:hypothetical protein